MDVPVSFGRRLKQLRRAHDLTQDQLACQVGCALITIKKIEADERRPSRQIAERMLRILAIPPDEQSAFLHLARPTPPPEPHSAPLPPAIPVVRDLDALPGQSVKGYEVRECLGRGRFGAVFRAVQPSISREVAIKVILPELADRHDFIRRFEAEAQTVARLEHPYIVPLYDYWREPGGAYLVMRYLRGGTLQALIQRGPLTLDVAARLLEQVGAALAAAHRQEVVHRDLKPTNILLDDVGNFYLADFGIAKDVGAAGLSDLPYVSAAVGSPAYLSPEQIRAEPVTPRTDIYNLGIVLYEALAGVKPFQVSTPVELMQQHLSTSLPPLRERRPDLPAALERVLQHATAKRPADRYPDVAGLMADALAALGTLPRVAGESAGTIRMPSLVAASPTIELDLLGQDNPYKGLRAFGEADAADFFGREALIAQLLERMAEESVVSGPLSVAEDDRQRTTRYPLGDRLQPMSRFLAVVGPSGSGKSSAVRAGLVPALRQGGLPGSENWFVAEVIPGAHPLEELEAALLRIAVNPPASLLEQLRQDERGLIRAVKRVLPADDTIDLVLVIDQFEELFTLVADEATRVHLMNSLVVAAADPRSRVRVVITLRGDFYDRPLLYGAFGELIRQRTEVVLPLAPDELAQAIARPAERAGLVVEPGLVAAIVKDVGEQPGTLPLLQYALTELFERRDGRTLTIDAYRASGGALEALARRADDLYARLAAPGQAAARQLFLRLIALGDGVEDTRRRVRRSELVSSAAMEGAIDVYGHYRLLTFDRDPITREPTVEVAHEALIRCWGRMREWLEANRERLRVQRRLMAAAAEWISAGQDPSFLATGARLAQFAPLAEAGDLALNEEEQAYLQASIAERETRALEERERQTRELAQARALAEEQRQRAEAQARSAAQLQRRAFLLAVALALVLVAGVAAVVFADRSASLANDNAAIAATAQIAGDRAVANAATATIAQGQALNNAATAVANFTQSAAQRLAAEANRLILERKSSELAALLSIRSMRLQYTPQGDEALAAAARLDMPLRRLSGHTASVAAVATSPNGVYALTGSTDASARLWDMRTGAEIRKLVHPAEVSSVAFSPDGAAILTGCLDGVARLWETETGREIRAFGGHTADVLAVAIAPSGRTVLTGSADKTARLWDAQTGALLQSFAEHPGSVLSVAYSPDGQTIVTGSTDRLFRIWDTRTASLIRTVANDLPYDGERALFTTDARFVLTSSAKTVHMWDVQSGAEVRNFNGHTEVIHSLAISHNGRFVLTGSEDATARLWDIDTGQELRRFNGKQSIVFGVAFSPDDRFVLTSGSDGTVLQWDLQQVAYPPILQHQADVAGAVFSPDGSMILTGSGDKTARLWDARTGREIRRFVHPEMVLVVAFAPDSKSIVTTSLVDNIIRQWDVGSGMLIREYKADQTRVKDVTFSHNGKLLLTADAQTARLWDTSTGREIRTFGSLTDGYSVAFSSDDRQVLVGGGGGTALFDTQSGAELRSFTSTSSAGSVAFSSDDAQVLVGQFDGAVRLWDAASGVLIRDFTGHTDAVLSVSFSSDGRTILSGSSDRTARLWDRASGRELRRFTGHAGLIWDSAISPDGRLVLTASSDGTARLWDADYNDTIRSLCGRLLRDFTDDERAQYNIADKQPTCP